jgi:amino acid adenylation domain-containing protein
MNAPTLPFQALTVEALLSQLDGRGVRLRLADGQLAVSAGKGALTDELRAALAEHKVALVALLQRRSAREPLPVLRPDPAARHEPFALTDVQHAYWMGRNAFLELGGVSTHVYLELHSPLELARLETALRRTIAHHDMLRAVIGPDGEQRVLPDVPPYELRVVDASALPADEREAALVATRAEMSHQLLPADTWPVFDIRATRLANGLSRVHLSLDLLIVDGASIAMFLRDWRRFYDEPGWQPEAPEVSFRDYVLAERALVRSAAWQRSRDYWLQRLDSLPPAPQLPVLSSREIEAPQFTRRRATFGQGAWQALKQRAISLGVTPSVLLLGVFAEVLRPWCKESAFTLNLTHFNRLALHPHVGRLLGDFTSITLLEVTAPAADDFGARTQRLQRQLARDLEHAAFSGVQVLRERARRLGGAPAAAMPVVFTSALVFDGDGAGALDEIGEYVYGVSQSPQVWFDHQVMEVRGELVVNWDCVEALFPPRVLDDMFEAYRALLSRLASGPEALHARRPVSLPTWQQAERDAANATAADLPRCTLHGMVFAQAARTPAATAVFDAVGEHSYDALARSAYRLARQLKVLGVLPGQRVAVSADKGFEQVVAVLAVLSVGAAYLPIDPLLPVERRALLLSQAGAEVVITQAHHRAGPWPAGARLVCAGDAEVQACADTPTALHDDPDALAYVIFTSGSTGVPKGVAVAHAAAANTVQDINRRHGVGAHDRVLALSALSFDLSVYDLFGMLSVGGALVMPQPARVTDPLHWGELVQRHRVSLWNSVPQLMQLWVETLRAAPAHAPRLALLSGDWIPVRLPDAVRALMPAMKIVSLGGATEGAIWSVAYEIARVDPSWPSIPYGKPLANQRLHVLGDDFEPRAVWATGEIFIAGAGLAQGYWGDEAKTAERFPMHPSSGERLYRTGDLARYLPGGDIEFLGRQDHQVKLNGYRVELGEIAAQLRRQTGVSEALARVWTGTHGQGRQLVAYVVVEAGTSLDIAALREALLAQLPEYMVPQHIVPLAALPLTPTGKVDPRALPAPWAAALQAASVPARDAEERLLHALWSDALEHDDFGVQDNFFHLGGNSLIAMRIITRVQQDFLLPHAFAQDLLRQFFENPTVAELAAWLRNAEAEARHAG